MNNRRRVLLVFLIIMAFATAGTLFAGQSIQSPSEAAARTAPPSASPILVPVEMRRLTSDIITRGTARFGLPKSISIAPSDLKTHAGIIATLPLQNAALHEGDVLLTASGRPIFILIGTAPVFRDLAPGIEGDDVLQLEQSLSRLGYAPGAIDGNFNEQTAAAVTAWYKAKGWQPFTATAEQLSTIHALERELAIAQNEKQTADEAVSLALLAVNAEKAESDRANKAAAVEVAEMTALWNVLHNDPNASEADKTNAVAALTLSQAAQKATELAGQVAVHGAEDAYRTTERGVTLAQDTINRLATELREAQRKTSVQVPADEIVFVPTLPARIDEISVAVGDEAMGQIMTVTNNQLAIDSSLRLDESALVKAGMNVAISEPDLGIEATGIVSRIAATPGTDGVDGFHVYFETIVEETVSLLEGFSLRLTIPVESTGEEVTVVPVSALSLSADGRSKILISTAGQLQPVVVEPGLSASGYVQVTPIDGTLAPGQLVLIGFEQ